MQVGHRLVAGSFKSCNYDRQLRSYKRTVYCAIGSLLVQLGSMRLPLLPVDCGVECWRNDREIGFLVHDFHTEIDVSEAQDLFHSGKVESVAATPFYISLWV